MFDNLPTALDLAEAARDAAEAAMLQARERFGSAGTALAAANEARAAGKTARAAIVQAALDGKAPDPAGLRRADKAIDEAEQSVRFNTDVARAAEDALRMATGAHKETCHQYHLQQLAAEHQKLNDEMAARCPEQPTDAELLALARQHDALEVAERGILIAYDRAYQHRVEPGPIYTPRGRVIQEGRMVADWLRWAKTAEPTELWLGAAPGATERSIVRRIRISLAATAHFESYMKLGWDDLRRLHGQDYERQIKPTLPKLRGGMIVPCAFGPL